MHFNARYKQYSEAVIGGRLSDIRKTKSRMFRLLADEIMDLARIQFIISTAVFLICLVVLGRMGYSGTVIQLYPCLCAGYFILYLMYAAFLFLYFFNDLDGAVYTGLIFCIITLVGSLISRHFDTLWYGTGLVAGAFTGWTYAYFRLSWLESHLHIHIFCNGSILKMSMEKDLQVKYIQNQRRSRRVNNGNSYIAYRNYHIGSISLSVTFSNYVRGKLRKKPHFCGEYLQLQ